MQRKNAIPNHQVTQKFDSSAVDNKINTEQDSYIFSKNLFTVYDNGIDNTKNIIAEHESNDKVIIGYTEAGLPFKILVRTKNGINKDRIFKFTEKILTRLLSVYSKELPNDDYSKIALKLEELFDNLCKKYHIPPEYDISLGTTYEKNNELFFSGFAIGELGMALRQPETGFIPIHPSSTNSRNKNFFNHKVSRGDKIFGYTWLHPQLRNNISESEYELHLKINCSSHENPIEDKTKWLLETTDMFALDNKITGIYGDQFTTSHLTIPSEEVQETNRNKLTEIKEFAEEKNKFYDCIKQVEKTRSIYDIATKIYDSFSEIEKSIDCNYAELKEDVIACWKALADNNNENIGHLRFRAYKAKGAGSDYKQALGCLMMVMGGILFAIGMPLNIINPAIGFSVMGVGLLSIIGGATLFANGRDKGQARDLLDYTKTCEHQTRFI